MTRSCQAVRPGERRPPALCPDPGLNACLAWLATRSWRLSWRSVGRAMARLSGAFGLHQPTVRPGCARRSRPAAAGGRSGLVSRWQQPEQVGSRGVLFDAPRAARRSPRAAGPPLCGARRCKEESADLAAWLQGGRRPGVADELPSLGDETARLGDAWEELDPPSRRQTVRPCGPWDSCCRNRCKAYRHRRCWPGSVATCCRGAAADAPGGPLLLMAQGPTEGRGRFCRNTFSRPGADAAASAALPASHERLATSMSATTNPLQGSLVQASGGSLTSSMVRQAHEHLVRGGTPARSWGDRRGDVRRPSRASTNGVSLGGGASAMSAVAVIHRGAPRPRSMPGWDPLRQPSGGATKFPTPPP